MLLDSRPLRYASATLLVAAACAGALVMNGRSGQSVSAAPAVLAPSLSGRHAASGPEALLSRTLNEVGNRRLEAAVSEIDKVIQGYPNFRLAHLIKGDLLLARARPLTTVGNASGAPRDRLEELREEARARLARIQQEQPVGLVPRYVVQMQPEQRHALVVDTARSTLYVFENRDGEAHYVTDYYISIGKNGIDKFREGDNKTPLGVYHVTGRLSREKLNSTYGKLAEQYGIGALPISYPNEWDRREGRNGHGIWLHGVPLDTYSRPPRASNGCVALTNEDFTAISRDIQIGLTPVIIANGVDWVAPGANRAMRQELMQQVENWRRDWENRDIGAIPCALRRQFLDRQDGADEMVRAEAQGQRRQDLDPARSRQGEHLPLPGPGRSGGGDVRPALCEQQSRQPDTQAPVPGSGNAARGGFCMKARLNNIRHR